MEPLYGQWCAAGVLIGVVAALLFFSELFQIDQMTLRELCKESS